MGAIKYRVMTKDGSHVLGSYPAKSESQAIEKALVKFKDYEDYTATDLTAKRV